MLILQNISYLHPGKDLLFENVNLHLNQHEKIALIGNNGSGKSTLLKVISGDCKPAYGQIKTGTKPYYIPQVFGQYNHLTIAAALQIELKLHALHEILNGNVTVVNLNLLNDDWTIEERCKEALQYWQLRILDLTKKMETLSGGQKTKVFLAGILIHQPKFILLDEPTNHLDAGGRELLYQFIQTTSSALIIVSHDIKALNLLDKIYELSKSGLRLYGGNYDFYLSQKQIENEAISQELKTKEKALRKAKEKERETMERQQKLDSRGKKKQEKAGVATIMLNTLRNNAERSTAKLKEIHNEKINGIFKELKSLQEEIPGADKMKFDFNNSAMHKGKIVFSASGINVQFNHSFLWNENMDLEIRSGERMALKGLNGSGKTTLLKIILGSMKPSKGKTFRAENKNVYIDQDYSLLDNKLTVYEQAESFNSSSLQEHEIKTRLTRFLFTKEDWDKTCGVLSGGEKMRLILCCLTISQQSPDIIILDEPTNNLDLKNIEILKTALNDYEGTMIVVSHDQNFLEQINVQRVINL